MNAAEVFGTGLMVADLNCVILAWKNKMSVCGSESTSAARKQENLWQKKLKQLCPEKKPEKL